MRERPILFSAPMVRAILEGRKTQTRRVVKPQPTLSYFTSGGMPIYDCGIHGKRFLDSVTCKRTDVYPLCPYGRPGDRLWVRETWVDLTETHGQPWERRNPQTGLYERGRHPFVWYAADGDQPDIGDGRSPLKPWRPSIHMPRWASYIDLEVTGVRVERLQDISKDDAITEGLLQDEVSGWYSSGLPMNYASPIEAFRALWESINGPGSWDANPWVWVVEFKRVPSAAGGGDGIQA